MFERKLVALPTMALTLASSGSWLGNPATGVMLTKLLHGEQFLTIHKPLPEDRAPDAALDLITRPEQAAISRLSGDWNPMHIDPKVAGMAGFGKPILHGMCAYGMAGRAILKLLCGDDPARLRKLNVRFASPVYPGETLRTEVWKEGAVLPFACAWSSAMSSSSTMVTPNIPNDAHSASCGSE